MMSIKIATLLTLALTSFTIEGVEGHSRIMEPVGRSSIWRLSEWVHLNPPENTADDAIRCGGVGQEEDPGRECGVCGDALAQPSPRDNEIGGRFYSGIIVNNYSSGQIIEVYVNITVNHNGHVEFRLCPNATDETLACFERYVLRPLDGGGSKIPVSSTGMMFKRLALPIGLRCEHCVIQTNYRSEGTGAVQEYRACSDVSIR